MKNFEIRLGFVKLIAISWWSTFWDTVLCIYVVLIPPTVIVIYVHHEGRLQKNTTNYSIERLERQQIDKQVI